MRKTSLFIVALFALTVLFSFAPVIQVNATGPTVPTGIISYVPITLSNTQSVAVAIGVQIMLNIDWNTYSLQLSNPVTNYALFNSTGNILLSWLENGTASSSTNSLLWFKNTASIAATSGTEVIYLGFYPTSHNALNTTNTGEFPTATGTYAQYDNGPSVFNFYYNWNGTSLSSAWTTCVAAPTYTINNGLTSIKSSASGTFESLCSKFTINPQTTVLEAGGTGTSTATSAAIQVFLGLYGSTGGGNPQYFDCNGYAASTTDYSTGTYNGANGNAIISPAITTGFVLFSLYTTTTAAKGTYNYHTYTSLSTDFTASTSQYIYVATKATQAFSMQWTRTRVLPPSGVNPSQSFGSVTYVTVTLPITCSTLPATAESGVITITSSDGQTPSPTTVTCGGSTTDVTIDAGVTATATTVVDTNTRVYFSTPSQTATNAVCTSGTCSTWTLTVYNQSKSTVSYSIVDSGSPTAPTLDYTGFGNTGATYTMTTTATATWLDYSTSWSVTPNPLTGSTSSERWYSTSTLSGTSVAGGTINPAFYNQYNLTLKYTVVDSGTPTAPTLTCTQNGGSYTPTVSTSYATYWCDNTQTWALTNPLTGSGSTERWDTSTTVSGTVTVQFTLAPNYYNQWNTTISYSLTGSGTPTAPTFSSTQFGSSYSPTMTTTATAYWFDNSVTWSVPSSITDGVHVWFFSGTSSGTVTSSVTYSFNYVEQAGNDKMTLYRINTGQTLASPDYFLVSYYADGVLTHIEVENGSALFTADNNTYITVAGISGNPTTALRFCLYKCLTQTFYNPSPGKQNITVGYYAQEGITLSYSITSGYSIVGDNPTFTWYSGAVLQSGTFAQTGTLYYVDNHTTITPALWFTNAQDFSPTPTSDLVLASGSQVFAYATSTVNGCAQYGNNVASLWQHACVAPAWWYTYANSVGAAGFMAFLFAMIEIPTLAKSKNLLLTLAVGIITAGIMVSATNVLDNRIILILWFATVMTTAAVFTRLWKGRAQAT